MLDYEDYGFERYEDDLETWECDRVAEDLAQEYYDEYDEWDEAYDSADYADYVEDHSDYWEQF